MQNLRQSEIKKKISCKWKAENREEIVKPRVPKSLTTRRIERHRRVKELNTVIYY